MKIKNKFKTFFISIYDFFKRKFNGAKEIIKEGDSKVMASFFIMGLGQLLYKQWVKGFIYLAIQILFIVYFVLTGASDFIGFFTLGSKESNEWYGVEGDNSIVMLIMGILSIIIIIFL